MKRFVCIFLLFIVAFGWFCLNASAQTLTDVALQKSASANGHYSTTPPQNAVDGRDDTVFASAYRPASEYPTLTVNLSGEYLIAKAVITEKNFNKNFLVYYSQNGIAWNLLGTTVTTGNTPSENATIYTHELNFDAVRAGYVRIVCEENINCQIQHFKVFGIDSPTDLANVALGGFATANGNYSSAPPQNAIDGRDDTVFASAYRPDSEHPALTVDLRADYLLSKVTVVEKNLNNNFAFYYSDNGKDWQLSGSTETVDTPSQGDVSYYTHELSCEFVRARYVRIVYEKNINCQIQHFQVWGIKAPPAPLTIVNAEYYLDSQIPEKRIYSVRSGTVISKVKFQSNGTKDLSTVKVVAGLYRSVIGGYELIREVEAYPDVTRADGEFSVSVSIPDVPKYGHKIMVSVFDGEKDISPVGTAKFELPMFYDSSAVEHPANLNLMMMHSERIRMNTTENSAAKIKEKLGAVFTMSDDEYLAYIKSTVNDASDMTNVDTPSALQLVAQRYALLYSRYEKNPNYLRRSILAMYEMAIAYQNVSEELKNVRELSYYKFIPDVCIYGYNEVYDDPMWDEISEEFGVNVRATIEDWFVRSVYMLFEVNNGEWLCNLTPFGIKQIFGVAVTLGSPDMIRRFLDWTDTMIGPRHFHSDGMWHEGSLNYHQQTIGNFDEALRLLQLSYADPADYRGSDHLYGLYLDKTYLRDRYPILNLANNITNIMKFPDGNPIAIHDTYSGNANLDVENKTITADLMKNIELNSFGHYALTLGDSDADALDTTQVHLTFPSIAEGVPYGGGHYHGNFLSMILWGGGVEALPDAGYPQARTGTRFYFHLNTMAHNTPWVWKADTENYEDRFRQSVRQSLLKYDDGTSSNKAVQLIEASCPGPEGDGTEMKRRLLMLIRLDGNRGYVFDLQRLKGGDAHEMYLRASEDEDTIMTYDGISLTQQTGTLETYLESIGKTEGLKTDRDLLKNPMTGSGETTFNFEWKGEESGSSVKTFTNGIEGSEVFFSQMPTYRRTECNNNLFDSFPNWHLYRRKILSEDEKEAGTVTKFASVYETFRDSQNGLVSQVEYISPADGDQMAYGVKVTSNQYIDTIYVSEDDETRIVNGFQFSGKVAVVRQDKETGEVIYGYLFGDGEIVAGEVQISGEADLEFTVTATNRGADFLSDNMLTLSQNLPENVKENDWILSYLGDGTGIGYKITDVENNIVTIQTPPDFDITSEGAKMIFYPTTNMEPGNGEFSLIKNPPRIVSGDVTARIYQSVFRDLTQEPFHVAFYDKEDESTPIPRITTEKEVVAKAQIAGDTVTFFALYDGSQLLKVKAAIPAAGSSECTEEFCVAGVREPRITYFIWSDMKSLQPLFPKQSITK